jgi:heme-degrading monooxygenase HmoA
VIARLWSARTTESQSPAYLDHFSHTVLPRLRELNGYAGMTVLTRRTGAEIEILVATVWRSLDAIRRFAGPDLEAAVVADEAAALLTDFDRRVRHYELVMADSFESNPAK